MPIDNPKLFQGEQSFGTTAGAPLSTDANNQLISGISNLNVSSATTITTTSATDVAVTGMTLTPVVGTYLVLFDTSVQSTAGGNSITSSIYVGGIQNAASARTVQFPTATLISSGNPTYLANVAVVGVNGSQAIVIEWHTNGGTATMLNKTLTIIRLS